MSFEHFENGIHITIFGLNGRGILSNISSSKIKASRNFTTYNHLPLLVRF